MEFQRAARTDKGVSAAGQVVSLKISLYHVEPLLCKSKCSSVSKRLNQELPHQRVPVFLWQISSHKQLNTWPFIFISFLQLTVPLD